MHIIHKWGKWKRIDENIWASGIIVAVRTKQTKMCKVCGKRKEAYL